MKAGRLHKCKKLPWTLNNFCPFLLQKLSTRVWLSQGAGFFQTSKDYSNCGSENTSGFAVRCV
jgi:hypothetical protein